MNRRIFFSRFGKCVAAAALAAHLKFGELVPLIPQTLVNPHLAIVTMAGLENYLLAFESRHGKLPKRVYVSEDEWISLNAGHRNVLCLHHRGVSICRASDEWDWQWHRDKLVGYEPYPEPHNPLLAKA